MPKKSCLTAVVLTAFGGPAFADLTAADVWADFQAYAATTGQILTAESETMSGDTLTVSGVTLSIDMQEAGATGTLGDIAFQERGDGTVAVIIPEEYTLSLNMDLQDEGVDEGTIDMVVRHTGLEMIASGTPEKTLFSYTAPEVSISFDEFVADGQAFPADFDATFTALSGEYEMTDGDPLNIRSVFNAGGLVIAAAVTAPPNAPEPGDGKFLVTMSSLAGTSTGTMSNFSAMSGLGQMIEQGLSSEGQFSYANAAIEASGGDGTDFFEMAASTGTGTFDMNIGPEGLDYSGESNDVAIQVAGSEIPLPDASLAVAQYAWALNMPIAVSEEPQDFGLNLDLNGLTISDMLWSMFDPGGALPRDPARLILDVAGRANWLVDITDPDIGSEPMEQMPGQIHALTVNQIRLALAGAELSGTGDFTFDNSAGPTAPPTPAGAVDLQLVGGNGLIDKLVAMGLLPEDQAMGARMMLGLFARPGDGEDTLVSKIEFTPEGGIVANGQPLR